ncbi:MAG: hypothetical protein Kow009_00970 [Spirochaetales bacterium]
MPSNYHNLTAPADWISELGNEDETVRLNALKSAVEEGKIQPPPFSRDVNNHVHTRYSFSPYSPVEVAYFARISGLQVVGSVDHDSISAAGEMKQAASLLRMGSTVGVEVRVSFEHTPFADRRLNNPDTRGNAYIVFHGVPPSGWSSISSWLQPIHRAREERNRRMVERMNHEVGSLLGSLSYDRDILPLSWAEKGGSVTERHILYGLALRILEQVESPKMVIPFLEEKLHVEVPEKIKGWLLEPGNPHMAYDILGVLKAEFLPRIFLQPESAECPPVEEATALARNVGAIPAYAYLGDVSHSPTGDKKAQTFEDSYLEELFQALPELGFQAVTYMPPRNTLEQLKRLQTLATTQGLMEISGVDINSSRQRFVCPEIHRPEFQHLIETTWALVGHEVLTEKNPEAGLFGPESPFARESLSRRVEEYARIGREAVPRA